MSSLAAADLTGRQKAALLLIALGVEYSSAVLKELGEHEVEQLAVEVIAADHVPEKLQQDVVAECYQMALANRFLRVGGFSYAERMLARALGDQRAVAIIDRLASSMRPQRFEFLQGTDAFQLASFIQDEQPQAIALILAHLSPARSAEVLAHLPPETQRSVALRIATLERTAPGVIEGVEAVLRKRLSGFISNDRTSAGGVAYLVKMLTRVDRPTERAILDHLESTAPALAEEVRNQMFVFENLLQLDDQSMQRLLRDVDSKDLAIALRAASENLKEAIFRNLSSRAAEMLKEEIEMGRPVRQRQIGEAQQQVVSIARRLDEAGEIVIQRGNENALV
jgi:flagellar motor switch protein FliG